MGEYEFNECLDVVNNKPFTLRPFFDQSGLEYALSEYLSASCSDITGLVIV